jgi:hypothetical protein
VRSRSWFSDYPESRIMKTGDLIAALSAHVEPVNRRLVGRTIGAALAVGTVLTFGIILIGLGIRTDLTTGRAVSFLLLKIAFAIGIVALASGLPDATGAARRRTQDLLGLGCDAIRRHRAPWSRIGAQHALAQDGHGR